jgi:hypothetical protein
MHTGECNGTRGLLGPQDGVDQADNRLNNNPNRGDGWSKGEVVVVAHGHVNGVPVPESKPLEQSPSR